MCSRDWARGIDDTMFKAGVWFDNCSWPYDRVVDLAMFTDRGKRGDE